MEPRHKKRKVVASGEEPRCVVHDVVPDDLLRLILLRLDSPLWLLRAACACKRWRRVVTGDDADVGRAFLRLARSLHPPVVVGHYHSYYGGGYRFVPSSPTPIRLSLDFFLLEIRKRHHTLDRWHVADCHGGLVLLRDGFGHVPDLFVCDPLSRQYRNIHHPPDLTSSRPTGSYVPRVFLLDGGAGDDGNISISNFRVLLYHFWYDDDVTKVYAFSTADAGDWRLVRQSTAASDNHDDRFVGSNIGHDIGRIDRSPYIASPAGSVRVLDNARLVFSKVDLPIRVCSDYDSTFAVVYRTSTEPTASPATACIVHVRGEGLELFRRIPSSGEWVLEHSIPQLSQATRGLPGYPDPELSRWKAVAVIAGGTRSAVLKASLEHGDRSWSWLFSLDVDTMQQQVLLPDVPTYLSHEMEPWPQLLLPLPHVINSTIYTLPWPQFLTALAS